MLCLLLPVSFWIPFWPQSRKRRSGSFPLSSLRMENRGTRSWRHFYNFVVSCRVNVCLYLNHPVSWSSRLWFLAQAQNCLCLSGESWSVLTEVAILPKATYRFNAIPIKLPTVFFTELEQIISQFVWKYKKTSNSQSNLEKEEWNWRNQAAWLQTLLQSHSHQDSMVLAQRQKYRSVEQNRRPRDKSMNLWTLTFHKGGKDIQWIKDNLFNKWCWENWSTTCKRN